MDAVDQVLTAHLHSAIERMLGGRWERPTPIEVSNRPELGDYASPIAFQLTKTLRRPPMAIAEELAEDMGARAPDLISAAVATAPGFLNLRLSDTFLADLVAKIHERGGRIADATEPTGSKAIIEHTNINPNKAAHVGHFRNACLGDTVARMLVRRGYDVEVQNYIDDTGVQVADVVVGLRFLDVDEQGEEPFDRYCSDVYVQVQDAFGRDPALKAKRSEVQFAIEHGKGELAEFAHQTAVKIASCNLATMARAGIRYDLLTWESDILALGFWSTAFDRLREQSIIRYEDDGPNAGCWIVPFGMGTVETDQGTVSEDKVLITSNDTLTYTAKDIAYQMWKFGVLGEDFRYRRWGTQLDGTMLWTSTRDAGDSDAPAFAKGDVVINVIDDRQSYPQQIVYECLRRLEFVEEAENSEHLAYAVVSLSVAAARELGVAVEEGARKVTMSGRGGIQVYADQLLDRLAEAIAARDVDEATAEAVAAAAARYYMLKFGTTQEIVFDFDDAIRTTGETGVYLQYALVRATGITRKVSAAAGPAALAAAPPPAAGVPAPDRALLLVAADWPRVLDSAATERSAMTIAKYAFDLSSVFNSFYDTTDPVVAEQDLELRAWRAGLVEAARLILIDVFDVLGIPAIDRL